MIDIELIPLAEVARRLGIKNVITLQRAIRRGELEAYNISGWKCTPEQVSRFVEARKSRARQQK